MTVDKYQVDFVAEGRFGAAASPYQIDADNGLSHVSQSRLSARAELISSTIVEVVAYVECVASVPL